MARELLGGLGGVLGEELFGRRRAGSTVGRAIARSGTRTRQSQEAAAARNEALAILVEVRTALEGASTVLDHRFLASARASLARAEAAKRPDTIARRALEAATRLDSYTPPAKPGMSESRDDQLLHELESALRTCVVQRLSRLGLTWWDDRVPEELRRRAERRKDRRENVWPWLAVGEHPLVDYLDFPDYAQIILEPRNWTDAFAAVFVEADVLRTKLLELEPLRTDIAHSRRLTPANRRRLLTYEDDILTSIRAHH